MKQKILQIIEHLEKMENNFNCDLILTAIYLYARPGKEVVEKINEEELKKLHNDILFIETIFNNELNEKFNF